MNHINQCTIVGNLATDIEIRTIQSGITRATFRVAVQRKFPNKQTGERETDFISVVAWRQKADFLAKYAHKGDTITIWGNIQTRSYDAQDGSKRHVTEINAEDVAVTSKGEKKSKSSPEDFVEAQDDDMPF